MIMIVLILMIMTMIMTRRRILMINKYLTRCLLHLRKARARQLPQQKWLRTSASVLQK